MSVREAEIAPSRALQRYCPRVVIGIAFLTVALAFGARNVKEIGGDGRIKRLAG